ncbi:sulfonate transport system substrate-binding protein [Actinoplanes lutulentus]|uniref:Putative aliphatic sulfonates-binding protein n=1 Tax=Actinoplanes lutulentus TaxID=1287878 RepID=A0A327ZHY1_9ACTN|nr:aliphatic sulfonate ABC transporter substrate-binding protein [Actinoplanes lutulentus]MBB2944200.1 sulfonate transport system substrate-binding protein [Actinoplanes lutulentus]RAK42567.1 sulfonate transport system substrate-binding protein [Actinoplanes lutulentus]
MRIYRVLAAAAVATALLAGCVQGEDTPVAGSAGDATTLRLDYAYYNPASLVLREQKWLETELAAKNVTVSWQLSAGSNKANEALRADAVDIGSTAGAAALVARANGSPIKTISVFSQPEWAAIVVPKTSAITNVAGLKGKKVAATKGTDPYFFLLQALDEAGLKPSDVVVTNLQHADGKAALERGDVDAWAGLDPLMATSELDAGSKLIYRNVAFNSYGVLNAREAFLTENPELAQSVVNAYEKARQWIKDNPDEATALYAREAKISEQVAKTVLTTRTGLDIDPVPGAAQRAVFEKILPVLVADANVKTEESAKTAIDTLFEPKYATARSVS